MTQDHTPRPSDRFIPWYFVGFFVFLMLLLGSFAWIAIRSYPGEISDDAYKTGQHYNATLAQADVQEKLGWKGSLTTTPSKTNPNHIDIHFSLLDAKGANIPDAKVHITWMRPTQEGYDQSTTLSANAKGGYTGAVDVPLRGIWNVFVHVTHDKDEFRQSQTVVLP